MTERLSDRDRIVYQMLCKAAEMGDECPSNGFLAGGADLCAANAASAAVKRLQEKGYIEVERFMRSRRVTITETGEQTRHLQAEIPHWRLRKKSDRSREILKNRLADLVADGRSIRSAAQEAGIGYSLARRLFSEIRQEMERC